MFGQSLLSAFGIACTTDTDQLFTTPTSTTSLATYQLNNATTSIPSNTYPGTASNITYTTGKFGDAAVFNGSSSQITLPDSIGTAMGNNNFSVSFWVYVNDASHDEIYLSITRPYDFYIRKFSSGSIYLNLGTLSYDTGVSLGTGWHHIAVTKSSSSGSILYLDNNANADASKTGNISANSVANSIGNYNGGSYVVDGKIDQVRIFNTALPASAITALYNETTTTAQSASIDYQLANPNSIAYYKMSDATDQLGNYNGTATNVNFNTEGKFGFAGAFNGSSSYVSLPAGINKNNNFSWSFWYMFNTHTSYDTPIGFFMNSCTNFIDTPSSGELSFYDGNSRLTTPSSTFTAGTWYHVVVTKSSTAGRKFYVNGSVVATDSGNSNSGSSSGGRNLLGAYSSSGNPTSTAFEFDGKLDQIRIYDSAISAADVTTLYKEVECSPAAINALDQFNTVLYTGNGNNRDIDVGFKPDFVWIKERADSAGYWHYLFDSIRGGNKPIFSNASNAESVNDNNGYLSSFNSNGFSITSGSLGMASLNGSGKTYVAWNWKAPLANLSTEFNSNRQGQITLPSSITTPWNTSNEFGVSCWINPSTWGSSQQTQAFSFNGPNSGNIGFDKEPSGNFRCFVTTSGGSFIGVNSSNNLSATNKWYHIVWTGSAAAGVKLYVDGVNTGSASWDGTYLNNTGTNSIGVSPQSLRGNIAQFRVYSSYLTASEVSDLYTEPAASNNTLNYPAGAGCIAAYPLQTDAVDLSGNYSGASSNVTFGQPGYLTSNTDGTITSAVAVNQEAGFSIVKYTGNGTAGSTVGHNLGVKPDLIIWKNTSATSNWLVYSPFIGNDSQWLYLNLDSAAQTSGSANEYPTNKVDPTSSVVTVNGSGSSNNINISGQNTIMYCFASIPGYSHIGSYVGTAAAGNFQYTGFQPSWLMVKCSSASGRNWVIVDDKRGNSDYWLYPNTADDEEGPYTDVVFNSTGFTLGTNASYVNGSGDTYIFLAIA